MTDEEALLYYMKTKDRMEEHYDEILELIHGNPGLLPLFYRELGRANSRRQRKLLREVGVTGGWFAIAGETIVASGRTLEEAQRAARAVLSEKNRDAVYFFKV